MEKKSKYKIYKTGEKCCDFIAVVSFCTLLISSYFGLFSKKPLIFEKYDSTKFALNVHESEKGDLSRKLDVVKGLKFYEDPNFEGRVDAACGRDNQRISYLEKMEGVLKKEIIKLESNEDIINYWNKKKKAKHGISLSLLSLLGSVIGAGYCNRKKK